MGGKALVALFAVLADTDDHCAGFDEIFEAVPERARLGGASRRLVLRVEVENDGLLAAELRERDRVAVWVVLVKSGAFAPMLIVAIAGLQTGK